MVDQAPLGSTPASNNASQAYGVHLNPRKSATVTFEREDKIIVLAAG